MTTSLPFNVSVSVTFAPSPAVVAIVYGALTAPPLKAQRTVGVTNVRVIVVPAANIVAAPPTTTVSRIAAA
jgi:hypothetical protein